MRGRVGALLALVVVTSPGVALADASIAPGDMGALGAWLTAGPLRSGTLVGSTTATPVLGETMPGEKETRWKLVASSSGAIDLKAQLKVGDGGDSHILVAGTLRVTRAWKGFFTLGIDGAASVLIDGRVVWARDDAGGFGDDDAMIAVDLAVGDHPVLIRSRHKDGAWGMRVRVTDASLAAARGVSLVLPGAIDAQALAQRMLGVSMVRGIRGDGYAPRLGVTCSEGLPRDAERAISASASMAGKTLFSVKAGLLPLEDDGPCTGTEVTLPLIADATLKESEQGASWTIDATVAGKTSTFETTSRAAIREALARAVKSRAKVAAGLAFLKDQDAALMTIDHVVSRIESYADRGDKDVDGQLEEVQGLTRFLDAIDAGDDPFLAVRGVARLARRSPLDAHPTSFGIYVPPNVKLDGTKKYPLVVAVHGMWGKPINMMRWIFGKDDPNHDGEWEDRHAGTFPNVEGIVITPMAHFNSMYRDVGEVDVVDAIRWVKKMFPIDDDRVSISGPSMGGTGTALVAFRYPFTFSSAAPLCGYHSYFLRGDMASRNRRPWETALAEQRSTVMWAENARHMPVFIVHGKKDLPEENSGVLIDRLKSLGYPMAHEHPDEGHNVWQPTYENLKGYSWLTARKRDAHPRDVVFKTDSLRYATSAWVQVRRLEHSLSWGEVRASVSKKVTPETQIEVKTKGITALALTRDATLVVPEKAVVVTIDGDVVKIDAGTDVIDLERRDGHWVVGITPMKAGALVKGAGLAGPIKDVFHEPIVVVVGTQDPTLRRANELVARWFAKVRWGVEIDHLVVDDVDLDPKLAETHALVLVGGPTSNSITARLDAKLPIHVEPGKVTAGGKSWSTSEAGAAFIHPNPEHPSHYVVVLAGTSVEGTLRALSLPELLPDYVIFDAGLAPARLHMVMGKATTLAAGMFDESWGL